MPYRFAVKKPLMVVIVTVRDRRDGAIDYQEGRDPAYGRRMTMPRSNSDCDIVETLRTCQDGADQWGHTTRLENGTPRYWCRIGVKVAGDSDRLASMVGHLNARRVR
jgi:hypothetical protein